MRKLSKFLTTTGLKEWGFVSNLPLVSTSFYNNYNDFVARTGYQEGAFDCTALTRQYVPGTAFDDSTVIATLSNGNYIKLRQASHDSIGSDLISFQLYDKNDTPFYQIYIGFASYYNDVTYFEKLIFFIESDNSDNIVLLMYYKLNTASSSILEYVTGDDRITTQYNAWISGSIATEDPYQTAPGSDAGGGYGDFDYSSDDVDFSPLPTLSVVDSGFVTLYNPTIGQLKSLAQYMWSGLFDINTFRKIFADPMDCIISLAMIPLTPSTAAAQELKVGNVSTGISINRLNSQFVEVNFAMKNIGLRSNGFMDFSPYTKAQIFLPYIGIRSLSIDDIAGKDLTLKYKIDLFTGACNAALKCGSSVLYQFTGNVIANIPITAQNFSGMLQAAIGAVGAAVGVATGAGALAGVASAVNAATSMKPDIERSGNLSATSGFLGQQLPYLILTYPNLCRPDGRDKTVGTPSFIGLSASNPARPLSAFHGITKLHKINVKTIPCTDAERDEIEALLMEGVILP